MVSIVKVSSKNHMTVPADARRALGIEPGDELLVSVENGVMKVTKRPQNYADAFFGLHKEVWADIDVREYLRRERDAWD
jgi:AbrB family looped-hinge helix DNA binding protein